MFLELCIFTEAFAVVREAAKRKLGMRHFDVQVSISRSYFVHSYICCACAYSFIYICNFMCIY